MLSASDLHAIDAFNRVAPVNVGKPTIDPELSEPFGHQEEELAVKLVEGLRRHLARMGSHVFESKGSSE